MLCGSPDEILVLGDGSYHIVDYKTARITGRKDELFSEYEVQLNAYAYIARELRLWPVSGLSPVYLEPRKLIGGEAGPALKFNAQRCSVELKDELVPQLLERAAQILRRQDAPPPQRGCRECERMEWFVQALS